DATEATPTFGVQADLVQAHFPGGAAAVLDSTIDFEDAVGQGREDLSSASTNDIVIGVSASGETPYVQGAIAAAKQARALTAVVTSNPFSSLIRHCDIPVPVDTGAEALTGSTRLKAGTATKVVL